MARELAIIRNEICVNFMTNPEIQVKYGFPLGEQFDDHFSKVSFEGILFYIIAFSIWTNELLFDNHKEWIEKRAKEIKPGTLDWYRAKALEYQQGDDLEFIENVYQYEQILPALQVVKLASATESGSLVILKVAKFDSSGDPEPLDPVTELIPFTTYMNLVKYAGVPLSVVSRPADTLKIYYRIYYNALVMNSDGELLSDTSLKPVEMAIQEYCKGLEFNGVLSITSLTDKIQQATGVVNPVFIEGYAKSGLLPYVHIQDYYQSNAGYLKIDPLVPLSTTIQYIQA